MRYKRIIITTTYKPRTIPDKKNFIFFSFTRSVNAFMPKINERQIFPSAQASALSARVDGFYNRILYSSRFPLSLCVYPSKLARKRRATSLATANSRRYPVISSLSRGGGRRERERWSRGRGCVTRQ